MRSRFFWTAVAGLALLNGGCGTAVNTLWLAPFEGGQRVYGGVRADLDVMRRTVAGESDITVSGEQVKATSREQIRSILFLTLDLPLSVIGDTLTLPYTLAVAVRRSFDKSDGRPDPDKLPPPSSEPATRPTPSGNALAPFAGNPFEAWSMSHRIEIPIAPNGP